MRALPAWELLNVWEWGQAQPAAQRALALLAAACPDTPPDALARLSVGQRDAHLLTLREWTFGPQLVSLVTCPGCGERLEFSFGVADIRVTDMRLDDHHRADPIAAGTVEGEEEEGTQALAIAGYQVRFRLPNSLDLVAIDHCRDPTAGRQLLLDRCLSARRKDEEAEPGELPDEVVDAVIECMAQADPQADVRLDLSCPACDHRWQAAFDIVSFFWNEIDTWAQRTLRQVHVLASAYGWREADILAMSPWRRQCYLEMVSE
jgi:hypothetical protein